MTSFIEIGNEIGFEECYNTEVICYLIFCKSSDTEGVKGGFKINLTL